MVDIGVVFPECLDQYSATEAEQIILANDPIRQWLSIAELLWDTA